MEFYIGNMKTRRKPTAIGALVPGLEVKSFALDYRLLIKHEYTFLPHIVFIYSTIFLMIFTCSYTCRQHNLVTAAKK